MLARMLLLCGMVTVVAAMADESSVEPRVRAGKISGKGTLIHRAAADEYWQPLAEGKEVMTRDLLMAMPGTRGAIETTDGNVRLELLGNLPAISDTPLLESAVIVHDSKTYDLDFTLARGRVILTNAKREGAVTIWARLADTAMEIRLPTKGDQAALELASRWAPGVPFRRDAEPDHRPTRAVLFHVLKGNAELKTGKTNHRLSAPPGPAYFQWDSLAGETDGPRRREEVPDWAAADALKKLPAPLQKQIEQLGQSLDQATVEAALLKFFESATNLEDRDGAFHRRRMALYGLGALDHAGPVLTALAASHPEAREAAVLALRQWVGRDARQDMRLYRFLTRRVDYAPAEAEALVHMLHSPFAADQPETFDTLIAYLRHSRPQIRELARWHLYALAPAGKSIPYDSTASEEERQKAYAAWKKLVPSGKLPPAVKP